MYKHLKYLGEGEHSCGNLHGYVDIELAHDGSYKVFWFRSFGSSGFPRYARYYKIRQAYLYKKYKQLSLWGKIKHHLFRKELK